MVDQNINSQFDLENGHANGHSNQDMNGHAKGLKDEYTHGDPDPIYESKSLYFPPLGMPEQLQEEIQQTKILNLIHPDNGHYQIWCIMILLWVAYCSFAAPFEFGFVSNPSLGFVLWRSFIDLFFMADIILTFFVAFRDQKSLTLVTSRPQIAQRYLMYGAELDVISTIPYNLIWYIITGHPVHGHLGDVLRFLAIFRLYRIATVYEYLSRLGMKNRHTYLVIRMVKLFINIVLASHFVAVAYFYLATVESDPENTWIGQGIGIDWKEKSIFLQYIASIYWSLFVITSIGPSYEAITTAEQIFCCFYSLFGMGALAYTLGTLTVLMVKESSSTQQYHEDVKAMERYSAQHQLPSSMKCKLRSQLDLHLKMKKIRTNSFLEEVPHHLRVALARQIYLPVVESSEFFHGCSQAFFNQLVSELHEEIVMPNSQVVTQGDVTSHLFIVASGELVRHSGNSLAIDNRKSLLKRGSVFGKVAIICSLPQIFTVRSVGLCHLLKIPNQAFAYLLKCYPSDAQCIMNNLKKKVHGLGIGNMRDISPSVSLSDVQFFLSQSNAIASESWADSSYSICASAAAGDIERIKESVVGPAKANCTDYYGRTPLHAAASHGKIIVVRWLIAQGADLNAIDGHGSTALAEAVRNGQTEVQEELVATGAKLLLPNQGNELCSLVASGNTNLLARYLRCGADPNSHDYCGRTPGHVACALQLPTSLQVILSHGGKVNEVDAEGRSILDLALSSNNLTIINMCRSPE